MKKILILFVLFGSSLQIWGNSAFQSKELEEQSEISVQKIPLEIGDSSGINKVGEILVHKNISKPYPVYINLHDDENISAEAALRTIKKYSGTLIELKHTNVRRISFLLGTNSYNFDPNRIFSPEGITNTLDCRPLIPATPCDTSKAEKEVGKFADKLKDLLLKHINPKAQIVIGMHNNTVGGGLTVVSYRDDPEFNVETQRDKLTGKLLVSSSEGESAIDYFYLATERRFYDWFISKGKNALMELNPPDSVIKEKGYLSVYCSSFKPMPIPYINVEGQHQRGLSLEEQPERLQKQMEMLELLQELLKKFNLNKEH